MDSSSKTMAIGKKSFLSAEQREHFLEHGWVRIPKAVPAAHVAKWTEDVWIRLGYDKDDVSTWKEDWMQMPRHKEMPWQEFCPDGWNAVCDIVGGEEKIDTSMFPKVGNGLIVNFGAEEYRERIIPPQELTAWHTDGNWFKHFLDSGEQAIVALQLFTDVKPAGGGTWICEDGLQHVIKWLHNRPQGTNPKCIDPDGTTAMDAMKHCKKFVELTGEAGDMYLCHPFMPHTASKNHLRIPRFIGSPYLSLRGPMILNRENPADYSLVELKTLRELGVSSLPDWKITSPRERLPSASHSRKKARVDEELQRMKDHAAKTGGVVESIHLNGITKYSGGTQI